MTKLQTIETRQRKSLPRDVMFAVLVAIASVISLSALANAVDAATVLGR